MVVLLVTVTQPHTEVLLHVYGLVSHNRIRTVRVGFPHTAHMRTGWVKVADVCVLSVTAHTDYATNSETTVPKLVYVIVQTRLRLPI